MITRTAPFFSFSKTITSNRPDPVRPKAALAAFSAEREDLICLQLSEPLAVRAAVLAWEHGLRGHDAVHLATALFWQETLSEPLVLAIFDRELRQGAKTAGVIPWPEG